MPRLFVCIFSLLCSALAYSQESATGTKGPQKEEVTTTGTESTKGGIEIIEVSVQRRLQDMQDVPVTVTQFNEQMIKDARLVQVDDIAVRTPGLSFDAFPSTQPRLFIRGVGSSDRGAAGDPSTAVFLDEVYLGRPAAIAFDVFDTSRIEVLKGPQGTLYGRNVVGGAVSIITSKPVLNELQGSAEATVGNFNRKEGAGYINLPIVDDLAAIRISGSVRQHDGFHENVYTGNAVDDQDTKSLRVHALFEPKDNLSLLLSYDLTKDDAYGPDQHVIGIDTTDELSAYWQLDDDLDTTNSETDGRQVRDTWGTRGQLIWDLDFASLNYITSYRELEYDTYMDLDGSSSDINIINITGGNVEESELFSQELRLQSLEDSELTWVVGLYQYNADTVRRDIFDLAIGSPAGTEIFFQEVELDSLAVFADATYPVTDKLNFTAGIRYTEDEKWMSINNEESSAIFRADEFFNEQISQKWDAITWRVGTDYHINSSNMVYTSVSKGFKSGGFQDNPSSGEAALDSYEPEYATQYEVGLRSDFFERSVVWNNTIFLMDYTDLQTSQTIGFTQATNNAGKATIKGYETDFTWRSDSGLDLNINYAFTDATFDEFVENSRDYSGNQISRTPEHKVIVSPGYVFLFESGSELNIALDYTYQSKIYDDNSNNELEVREPAEFLNARMVFTDELGNWSVSLWGKNLTDERTRTHQATFLGALMASFNPPRTFGVTVRWNYF